MSTARPDLGTHQHKVKDAAYLRATQDTCAVCGLPIDPTLKWPDPMSFSQGHILAVKNGGSTALHNKQAEHLHCNTSKGARTDPDTPPNVSRRW